jgi:hypothetical protein
VLREREEGAGRKDGGVLRDGKTSFSAIKSMRGAAGGPGGVHRPALFTSCLRLGRPFGAVLCANLCVGGGG